MRRKGAKVGLAIVALGIAFYGLIRSYEHENFRVWNGVFGLGAYAFFSLMLPFMAEKAKRLRSGSS